MTCGRCGEEVEGVPVVCWFCRADLCCDCADEDGTCRKHPESAGLTDQQIAERIREAGRPR
jgi:hypothetical protein